MTVSTERAVMMVADYLDGIDRINKERETEITRQQIHLYIEDMQKTKMNAINEKAQAERTALLERSMSQLEAYEVDLLNRIKTRFTDSIQPEIATTLDQLEKLDHIPKSTLEEFAERYTGQQIALQRLKEIASKHGHRIYNLKDMDFFVNKVNSIFLDLKRTMRSVENKLGHDWRTTLHVNQATAKSVELDPWLAKLMA